MRLKGSLQPIVLQIFGLLLLVAFVLIWTLTGEQSPLLVGASLTLVAVGSGTSAIINVRHDIHVEDEEQHKTTTISPEGAHPSSESVETES